MKKILVEEVYQLHGMASACIPEDIPLEDVIKRFACEPGIRGVFLVDSHQRFAGMITPVDLVQWASLRFHGKLVGTPMSAGEVFRITFATEVKDLARGSSHSLGVKPSDTLQNALEKMIIGKEDIIPVVDNEDRVLGDLRLSAVLLQAIEAGKDAPICES
jgi:CBS domain-containing protein